MISLGSRLKICQPILSNKSGFRSWAGHFMFKISTHTHTLPPKNPVLLMWKWKADERETYVHSASHFGLVCEWILFCFWKKKFMVWCATWLNWTTVKQAYIMLNLLGDLASLICRGFSVFSLVLQICTGGPQRMIIIEPIILSCEVRNVFLT